MVSPVRIRVPPLKKVLQIAEKERPLAVPLGPFVRGVSTGGSKKAASSSAVVAESCIYCLWCGRRWRGLSCYANRNRSCSALHKDTTTSCAGGAWRRADEPFCICPSSSLLTRSILYSPKFVGTWNSRHFVKKG